MKNGLRIEKIKAMEILNSRGNPTPYVSVRLRCGAVGTASAPSGASRGSHEATELLDGDSFRYNGKGVQTAVKIINKLIAPALEGKSALNLIGIDQALREIDQTDNFSKIGGNSAISVSVATAKALARALNLPLFAVLGGVFSCKIPTPMMNLINGGGHAKNCLDVQEFMVVPNEELEFSAKSRMGAEIYHSLGKIIEGRSLSTAVGDEGGFGSDVARTTEEAIELIIEAGENAGYKPYEDFRLALDFAASDWEKNGVYYFPKNAVSKTKEEMQGFVLSLFRNYPVFSVEDPFSETDYSSWQELTRKAPKDALVVGDDLFVTNRERLKIGAELSLANAVIIKPNQVGTLSDAISASSFARENALTLIASHRSGETAETWICDVAMAVGAKYIKIGAPCRQDRTEKYNRFLKLEQMF